MLQTEIETYEAFRVGDETAFEMIFKSYYSTLCRYANSFLEDPQEAEEVVQSSFINFWERRQSLDITVSIKSYLYRAVRNSCLNVIKHERVKREHAQHEVFMQAGSFEAPAQTLATDELEQRIYEAMQKLPEQCRLVFQMSRFEELKYQEIADQLNISIKTVENQIGKALKIMREQLRDYLPFLTILMKGLLD